MAFESILNLNTSKIYSPPSGIFTDLNLDQVIQQITADWKDITKDYYYFPASYECELYRREILKDLKDDAIRQAINAFLSTMKFWENALNTKDSVEEEEQRNTWLLLESGYYIDAIENLYNALTKTKYQSKGFSELVMYLSEYQNTADYLEMKKEMTEIRNGISSFHFRITYDKERIYITEEVTEVKYDDYLKKLFPNHNRILQNPFHANPNWKELEYEIYKLVKKKSPELFNKIKNYYKKYKDYCQDIIIRFKKEIGFYLSFLSFEEKMLSQGFYFTTATTNETQEMYADGLYDIALACTNIKENKPVVENDFRYATDELFFVVTGPNQGGKTTFARSLGQLVYFNKMGLDVPAKACNSHYFKTILTHFSVEESIESGKGKLKEELTRLKPMMKTDSDNAFVIINELFTTAANYDACIMGTKVIEYFIAKNCHGIYVTHLIELASVNEKIVSMKAMLDTFNKQTFKIERSEATEFAYADNQVNKYRLRYNQIKERLQEKEQ